MWEDENRRAATSKASGSQRHSDCKITFLEPLDSKINNSEETHKYSCSEKKIYSKNSE